MILLKAAIPPEFAGMAGYAGQQEPYATLRGLSPFKMCCSLTEGSDKADKTGDTLFSALPGLCAVATANIHQEQRVTDLRS